MKYLNLGCGNKFNKDWTNIDFISNNPDVIEHDLSKGIPFKSFTFDAVYSSHLLEHLTPDSAKTFLKNCFNVLKDNGIIRVVVPDLESIVKEYLNILSKCLNNEEDAHKKYEWIIIELIDQMVRNHPGGEMLKYLQNNTTSDKEYILKRIGSEAKHIFNSSNKQNTYITKTNQKNNNSAEIIGKFRISGEPHQWMYDRFSLQKLLKDTGFIDVKVCDAYKSDILNFSDYHLDVEPDGSIRKPDSLFIEAKKPKLNRNSKTNISNFGINFKISQFCTQDFGGAGTAALRLHNGLLSQNIDSTLYVSNIQKWENQTNIISIQSKNIQSGLEFISPEWKMFNVINQNILKKFSSRPQNLELFTTNWANTNIKNIININNSDFIHFHWISGFINLQDNIDIFKDKHIVWTLHDMNPFTGGCHYAGNCKKYINHCGACPQLGSNNNHDLSHEIWKIKKNTYSRLNISIVAPSRWIGQCAKNSSLFSSFPIYTIPNGVPTHIYKPYSRNQIRAALNIPQDSFIVLFGADSTNNARKGFSYLLKALDWIKHKQCNKKIELVIFGRNSHQTNQLADYKTYVFDYISNEVELSYIYNIANLTVVPSIEDNLPNIILESLSCGVPVCCFKTGGMQDIITHKNNGYLAKFGDHCDLATGILWFYNNTNNSVHTSLCCRETALSNYNMNNYANNYLKLYSSILSSI